MGYLFRATTFSLIAIGSLLVGSYLNQARAQTYFSEDNLCLQTAGVNCPFGSEYQKEQAVGDTFVSSFSCIPKTSEFCTLVTGNPQVAHKEGSEQYCLRPAQTTVGRCDKSVRVRGDAPVVGGGVDSWLFAYNTTSGNGQTIYNNLESIFGRNNYYDDRGEGNGQSKSESERLECLEVEIGGKKELRVRVPRLAEDLRSDEKKPYSHVDNIQNIYNATKFGLVVRRQDDDPRFCADPNAVYIRNEGSDEHEGVCYTGIGGRPCMIKNVVGGGGTNYCVTGIKSTARGTNFIPIFRHYGYTGSVAADSFGYLNWSTTPNMCRLTSKDMLENSTNKGCADFLEIRRSDNTLQFLGTEALATASSSGATASEIARLEAEVKKNEERYDACLKCLYGNAKKLVNNPGQPDHNMRTTAVKAYDASGNPITAPAAGTTITMDNEFFAQPIQGRLFNDLGCVNAAEPNNIINTVLRCALALMSLLVVLRIMQGALYMQSVDGFDPERIKEGRDIIVSALIAILVLILSAVILNFLGINILNLSGQGFAPFR